MKKTKVPHSLVWDFNSDNLRGKQYINDLDFIKNNLDVDNILLSATADIPLDGVALDEFGLCF